MSPVHRSTEVVAADPSTPLIFVVEDNSDIRVGLRELLEFNDMVVEEFASAEDFLASAHPERKACLLLDLGLPGGMGGLELLRRLQETKCYLPTIFITGGSNVKMAIECMRMGALDLLQKPIADADLLASIANALGRKCWCCESLVSCHGATDRVSDLTARQRQLMDLTMAGYSGRSISADLGINQRTAEKHRASMMKKMGAKSIFALAQLLDASSGTGFCGDVIPGRGGTASRFPDRRRNSYENVSHRLDRRSSSDRRPDRP
jgi:two-component system CheB/CheR fusion protein